MSAIAEKILADALELCPQERSELIDRLAESLDADDESDQLHPEWEAEIARRIAEIDSGRAKMIPWPEALRQMLSDDESINP